mmetsp:Transcript_16172/g.51673  ORF Transcript_16172/g.51673 Transcript_16172/m.51673 type:complete len:261 (-) Transcript_16172:1060-1842(-)
MTPVGTRRRSTSNADSLPGSSSEASAISRVSSFSSSNSASLPALASPSLSASPAPRIDPLPKRRSRVPNVVASPSRMKPWLKQSSASRRTRRTLAKSLFDTLPLAARQALTRCASSSIASGLLSAALPSSSSSPSPSAALPSAPRPSSSPWPSAAGAGLLASICFTASWRNCSALLPSTIGRLYSAASWLASVDLPAHGGPINTRRIWRRLRAARYSSTMVEMLATKPLRERHLSSGMRLLMLASLVENRRSHSRCIQAG